MMNASGEAMALTDAQLRFAAKVDAVVGLPCPGGAVCMYREGTERTVRWIVSPKGRILDQVTFGR